MKNVVSIERTYRGFHFRSIIVCTVRSDKLINLQQLTMEFEYFLEWE